MKSAMASICVSVHAGSIWLGVAVCVLLVASFISFTRPVLTQTGASLKPEVTDA